MKKGKKIMIIVIVVVALCVSFIGLSKICKQKNEKEQANLEQIYAGGEKKALVLYQESISNMVTDSVEKIKDKLLENEYTVTQNHPRTDLTYDLGEYDLIVFVSPIYARSFSKPMKAYIQENNFENKQVMVLITGMLDNDVESKKAEALFPESTKLLAVKAQGATDDVLDKLQDFIE